MDDWSTSGLAPPWSPRDALKATRAGFGPIWNEPGLILSTQWSPTVKMSLNQSIALTPVSKLETSLHRALLEGTSNYQLRYIPADKQDELITMEAVSEVMNATGTCLNDDIVRYIVGQDDQYLTPSNLSMQKSSGTCRRKLFAILVMLGVPAKIHSFINEGIWDRHLPFQRRPTTNEWEYRDDNSVAGSRRVRCFQDDTWDQRSVVLFDIYQWYLLSPVFDFDHPRLMHYCLHRKTPLPFIEVCSENRRSINGGFGEVRRVRIHPAHHNMKVGSRLSSYILPLSE